MTRDRDSLSSRVVASIVIDFDENVIQENIEWISWKKSKVIGTWVDHRLYLNLMIHDGNDDWRNYLHLFDGETVKKIELKRGFNGVYNFKQLP